MRLGVRWTRVLRPFVAWCRFTEGWDEARKKGIVTLGTAATPDEAIAVDQAGVEVVVASDLGTWLRDSGDSEKMGILG
jgi:hypothetical protein